MYTYPNPLNSRLTEFYLRMILVLKKQDIEQLKETLNINEQIIRKDKYGNSFYYFLLDEVTPNSINGELITLSNIFDACKLREVKERVAYIPVIPA